MKNTGACRLIFPNLHDEMMNDLTAVRALGSIPFGGRYRLVDFALSNLVHAGYNNVGIVTTKKYLSLTQHIGSGKAWDLSRKKKGLSMQPALGATPTEYEGRIIPLHDIREWLELCREEYVILSDCYVIGNINYKALVEKHIASDAEITVAYKVGACPEVPSLVTMDVTESGRVTEMRIGARPEGDVCYGIGLYVMAREKLMELVEDAFSCGRMNFERDILQARVVGGRIRGYEVPEFTLVISSLQSYFDANMALMDKEIRAKLFPSDYPVYTRVHDCAPVVYGLNAEMTGSLAADGAHIDGTVTDSLLFRNVRIETGATVRNCILMEGSIVRKGAVLENVVLDKKVTVSEGRVLRGAPTYPLYVNKGRTI